MRSDIQLRHTANTSKKVGSARWQFLAASTLGYFMLSACAALPSSGPTSGQILSSTRVSDREVNFKIVQITSLESLPPISGRPLVFQPDHQPLPTNLIGAGDVLEISIYESGVTLFGGSPAAAGQGFDPTASVERFPPIRVDDRGMIQLPFAGSMQAAGLTSTALEHKIRRAYIRMSQNPQVLVAIRDAIGNSVMVAGEVVRPGRLTLSTNRESLSDVIAMVGGYRGNAKDLSVRLQRGVEMIEIRLSDVMSEAGHDIKIHPSDKISIVSAPRTFAVMGAPGRVEHMTFSGPTISLAEALAQAGGSNPNLGDPEAIFVFRFEVDEFGKDAPIVYHINMMDASGYILSQRFAMRDKDVLYIGNAAANQPSKFIQLISQLFAPIVTAGNLANGSL